MRFSSYTIIIIFCIISILFKDSSGFNPCSTKKMREAYREMKRVQCKNCDKYFHCKGNYDAIYKCRGFAKMWTANKLSNARELFGNTSGKEKEDFLADQRASIFGRTGGNCVKKYLRKANCAYNPKARKCFG